MFCFDPQTLLKIKVVDLKENPEGQNIIMLKVCHTLFYCLVYVQ